MANEKEKTTVLSPSVGADGGQPSQICADKSISEEPSEINPPDEDMEEMYRQMLRMSDPYYLHAVSMTELYQTSYKSRPPVIDGLLYAGAYILAGAPKIGKSFLMYRHHTNLSNVWLVILVTFWVALICVLTELFSKNTIYFRRKN